MTKHELDTALYHAIRAAKHLHIWGVFAASRYARKRGVPAELLIKELRNV